MRLIADAIKESIGHPGPIGVFDSGYGGLTILRELRRAIPDADFLYLGDNARAPYGSRSFDLVYNFTLEAVRYLFARGCQLVILACNTASAKALRNIQQHDLPAIDPARRVLGVIRPTTEIIDRYTDTGHIGLFATPGTVASQSYDLALLKSSANGIRSATSQCRLFAISVKAVSDFFSFSKNSSSCARLLSIKSSFIFFLLSKYASVRSCV